jgi:hypothetical protein
MEGIATPTLGKSGFPQFFGTPPRTDQGLIAKNAIVAGRAGVVMLASRNDQSEK